MRSLSNRAWQYSIAVAAVLMIGAVAFRPAKQFHRFFLTACAADGPDRETELNIEPPPVDLAHFYAELRAAAADMAIQELAQAEYAGERWPILLISPVAERVGPSVLIVAGIHGNEVSGSTAAIEILRWLQTSHIDAAVYVLAPSNPVGLKAGSRYNSMGCDVNRDFNSYRTPEAQAIRTAVNRVKPQLIVSLHEGPQHGVFVIGTELTPEALLQAMITELQAQRVPLARENNLGVDLQTPGLMIEGALMTRAKHWLGIYSLGELATSVGVPLVTTEVPWSDANINRRVKMQRIAAEVAIRYVANGNPDNAPPR